MDAVSLVFWKSIIKPYYQQNAGFFLFIFVVLFGVLPPGQQFTFHYHLILGMLSTPAFFLFVLILWMMYALKTILFVMDLWRQSAFAFIYLVSSLNRKSLITKLFQLHISLYLPVGLYALCIIIIAFYKGNYMACAVLTGFNAGLCLFCSLFYQHVLKSNRKNTWSFTKLKVLSEIRRPYFIILISYILNDLKAIFISCKLITCLLLFRILTQQDTAHGDLRMPFLIFTAGMLGHSALFYKCREFELNALFWWRTLPVSIFNRFLQYAGLGLFIFIPEIIGLWRLTSQCLLVFDALLFIIYGYSLLIFMNGILLISRLSRTDHLQILLGVFILAYFFILGGAVGWLSLLFFSIGVFLFFTKYYTFDNRLPTDRLLNKN